MIVKVCGISTQNNYKEIAETGADMIGLNFYKKSARYIGDENLNIEAKGIKKVGVFVNASLSYILEQVDNYNLDFIQLHGDEGPEFCQHLADITDVIKVFKLRQGFNFELCEQFKMCSYYLFDKDTKDYGGSGEKFNWTMLEEYTTDVPFFIAGGISPKDAETILQLKFSQLIGVDINSRFELKPGIKKPELVKEFIQQLKLS